MTTLDAMLLGFMGLAVGLLVGWLVSRWQEAGSHLSDHHVMPPRAASMDALLASAIDSGGDLEVLRIQVLIEVVAALERLRGPRP